jgi:hypothetical protein
VTVVGTVGVLITIWKEVERVDESISTDWISGMREMMSGLSKLIIISIRSAGGMVSVT